MFSEAVDTVITRTARSDKLADIVGYLNSTIKECQLLQFFAQDLIEDTITGITASPYTWTRPARLRLLRTVRYDDDVYPLYKLPGKAQVGVDNYYYAGAGYYVFKGSFDSEIDVAYYRYLPRLAYYAEADRPAVYNENLDTWTYAAAYDIDDHTRETARNLVSNWLLSNWGEMIIEGGMAKLYKSTGDQRTITSYSMMKTQQTLMLAQETYETLDK